MKLTYLSA